MKRTGRTLVILTVAFWLAAPGPAPALAGRDPVRIGVGVGGELVDLVSPTDDDEGGEHDEDNGDGLLDGLVELLVGGDEDDGDDDGLVGVVQRLLDALFGEDDDDSVHMAAAVPVMAPGTADDDDGVVDELVDEVIDIVEEVVDVVTDSVEHVVCVVGKILGSGVPMCEEP